MDKKMPIPFSNQLSEKIGEKSQNIYDDEFLYFPELAWEHIFSLIWFYFCLAFKCCINIRNDLRLIIKCKFKNIENTKIYLIYLDI